MKTDRSNKLIVPDEHISAAKSILPNFVDKSKKNLNKHFSSSELNSMYKSLDEFSDVLLRIITNANAIEGAHDIVYKLNNQAWQNGDWNKKYDLERELLLLLSKRLQQYLKDNNFAKEIRDAGFALCASLERDCQEYATYELTNTSGGYVHHGHTVNKQSLDTVKDRYYLAIHAIDICYQYSESFKSDDAKQKEQAAQQLKNLIDEIEGTPKPSKFLSNLGAGLIGFGFVLTIAAIALVAALSPWLLIPAAAGLGIMLAGIGMNLKFAEKPWANKLRFFATKLNPNFEPAPQKDERPAFAQRFLMA